MSDGNDDKVPANKFLKACKIINEEEVYLCMKEALSKKKKFSLVRLGDGEALTLAQQKVMPVAEVAKRRFLRYAGVVVPDLRGRDRLAFSIKKADIIGIPINLMPDFLPLLLKAFAANHIDSHSMNLTNACINYFLYQSGRLKELLLDGKPKVLVIGNKGKGLTEVFKREGVRVVAIIAQVYGLRDINRVVKLSQRYTFDIALVGAGVAAVVICERIANLQNKIALDIGHVADNIVREGSL